MGGSVGGAIGNLGKKLGPGGIVGGLVGGPVGALIGSQLGKSGGGPSVPQVGGTQDPLSMLTMSGGAPLLTNVALGADVGTSLMGYFGASGDYNKWFNNLNPSDQQAVQGLHDQLTQVQSNTDMRNQAVSKLANDFPNIMAAAIPKYSAMADSATSDMMNKALNQISAKQAAGGSFSSGATAAAAARAGADIGMQKLQFGTTLGLQDFQQQFNNATALQSFQQKMLGQGATQGFNAVQNALGRNANIAQTQAGLQGQADQQAYQSQQGMMGALGALGGTVLGGMLGGPPGAMAGNSIGGSLFSSPRLNISGTGFGGQQSPSFGR